MLIVDTHPHIMTLDTAAYPPAPVGGTQSAWSLGVSLTAAEFAHLLRQAGVTAATVVQASTVYGYDNSYLADAVAAYPGVFAGICCVDPVADDAAERLAYWITERGLHGVRLFATSAGAGTLFSVDDPRLARFWAKAAELGIPVDVQVRYPVIGTVKRLLRRHPGVTVILDHLSTPPLADGPPYRAAAELFELAEFGQLYLKVANRNLENADEGASTTAAFLEQLVERFGADRIMWGSNFPNTEGKAPPTADTYANLVNRVVKDVSPFGGDVQRALLGGTARALYPGLAG
jgi:predicted TIM-barrel fold metal-dependent hydrolase